MGADKSRPFTAQLNQYKVVEQIPHNNQTHLAHIETEKEYMARELTFNDHNAYLKSLEEHKGRQSITEEHLTHLTRVEGKEIDQLCSNIYKVYALWEYPHRCLGEEITERATQNRKFQEKELWSILASCILSLSTLQKNKIRYQTLTTKVLLLDSEGLIKVADPLAHANRPNLDAVYNNRQIKGIYLSPEQCQTLESRGSFNNSFKCDVWSLGMILLQCGLLSAQDDAYRDEYQRIDHNYIEKSLRKFRMTYSEDLKGLLQYMLQTNCKNRPDWIDLETYAKRAQSQQSSPSQQKNPVNYTPYNNMPVRVGQYSNQSFNAITPQKSNTPIYFNGRVSTPSNAHLTSHVVFNHYQKPFNPGENNARTFILPSDQRMPPSRLSNPEPLRQAPSIPQHYQNGRLSGIPNREVNQLANPIAQRPISNNTSPVRFTANQQHAPSPMIYNGGFNQHFVSSDTLTYTNVVTPNINSPPTVQEDPEDSRERIIESKEPQGHQLEYVQEKFQQGSRYEGYKLGDMRHGQGKFYYQDGGLYDGNWTRNKMDGLGSLYYQSGKIAYEGHWRDDQFQGKGKLFNQYPTTIDHPFDYRNFDEIDQFWESYEGQFVQDFKKGRGLLKLSNGQYFEGHFDNDMVQGEGVFHRMDGTIVRGVWHSNHLHSQ